MMFTVRALLLPIFVLIGFAAAFLPSESSAAPGPPSEVVSDLYRDDLVAPETELEGANRKRPQRVFDEDQPELGANRPRPERPFDEGRPERGANRPRPERPFDEDQPRLSTNPSTGPVEIRYGSTELRVDVFDVTGRRIATLSGAAGTASWDGRDTSGRTVARGIYFARVLAAQEGSPKVVRITRR
jgi:hypothetical protein